MSRLGAGIISYFTLIKVSFFFFFLASLASIPLLIQYSSWHYKSETREAMSINYSLGNLGESEKLCQRVKLASD